MKRISLLLFASCAFFLTGCAGTSDIFGPSGDLCEFDTDDDGLNQSELEAGLIEEWDDDEDGLLSAAEFVSGVTTRDWEDDWDVDFNDWDADADGYLDEGEFSGGIADAGLWDDWDDNDDGSLNDDECVV